VSLGSLKENPLTPINVGNPHEFKVIELAELVAKKLCGGKLSQNHHAMPVDDPTQRRPDITQARDLLGWEPRVELNEGLDKTITYFKNEFGRIRTVRVGPDGMLYLTTSNRDGRGSPKDDDDKIIRVNPASLK
jgi:hypothetical protein